MFKDLVYLTAGVCSVMLGSVCSIPTCDAIGIIVGGLTAMVYGIKLVRGV